MAGAVHWRVGRRIPKNVYRGDEIAGQFQREEWAQQAVEALNRFEAQRAKLEEKVSAYVQRYGRTK